MTTDVNGRSHGTDGRYRPEERLEPEVTALVDEVWAEPKQSRVIMWEPGCECPTGADLGLPEYASYVQAAIPECPVHGIFCD